MRFDAQPLVRRSGGRREAEAGPTSGGIDNAARFPSTVRGFDQEGPLAGDSPHRHLQACLSAGLFRGAPERQVEMEAGDAGGGRSNRDTQLATVEKETG